MLTAEDDAATAQWGDGWRMPTKADWQELIANTTNAWVVAQGYRPPVLKFLCNFAA